MCSCEPRVSVPPRAIFIVGLTCLAVAGFGQSSTGSAYSINASNHRVPEKDQWEIRLDGRFFGGDESLAYFGGNAIVGLGNGFALGLNGGFAPRRVRTFGANRFRVGGTDIELQAKYAIKELPGLAISAGISAPATPNQRDIFFTGRAVYGADFEGGSAFIGATGAFRSNSNLAAITLGGETTPTSGFSFLGEINLMVAGNNTYDRAGNLRRVTTYGVGVRYRQPNDPNSPSFMLAWTNALGSTTGFSLSPGLNNSGALYVGVSFSR